MTRPPVAPPVVSFALLDRLRLYKRLNFADRSFPIVLLRPARCLARLEAVHDPLDFRREEKLMQMFGSTAISRRDGLILSQPDERLPADKGWPGEPKSKHELRVHFRNV